MSSRHNEDGFTLIELLVVVAIIGILAGIAIPSFSAYRSQGYDSRATSDLRNLATAQEAYFASNASYTTNLNSLPGFQQSPGVNLSVDSVTGTGFTASSSHSDGTTTYSWDSENGGLQGAS